MSKERDADGDSFVKEERRQSSDDAGSHGGDNRGRGDERGNDRGGRGDRGGDRRQKNGEEEVRSLFVRGLSDGTRSEDLMDAFQNYGNVMDCYLPMDYYSGKARGFAYIQYVPLKMVVQL
ncbi:hypothetical protein PhCBS80983_g04837 [Powellomyces hirtus]|uniref:RRM domain-containing protein n=1 Tax=Powellomyces hirtus TaxID=109895 RepID=A0A507DYZ1_9FUNG|nr:hypothetical protein PhCBS80983_g04837 [Powellomyces hirtus]